MSTGPLTKNADNVALGLAQIRVGSSADNIATTSSALTSTNSIGALASTKWIGAKDYWTLESGFPMLEDKTLTIREKSSLECEFKEINPFTIGLSMGMDPTDGTGGSDLSETISGELLLGALADPKYVRMEALYTYPNGTSTMTVIFPRAQVISNSELDLQTEDAVTVPITFEAKRADSGISGGNAAWDSKPLGHILFV